MLDLALNSTLRSAIVLPVKGLTDDVDFLRYLGGVCNSFIET